MGKSCKVQVLGSRKRNSASDAEIAKIKQCQSKKKETFKSKITNLKNKVVTNVKKAEDLYVKFKNFGHHDEFDISGITPNDIERKIKDRKVFYNHFVDQTNPNKWEYDYMLKKIENKFLPDHLIENKNKYKEWFDQND